MSFQKKVETIRAHLNLEQRDREIDRVMSGVGVLVEGRLRDFVVEGCVVFDPLRALHRTCISCGSATQPCCGH